MLYQLLRRTLIPAVLLAIVLRTGPLAQSAGATIVGVVKDTSGAVLPGVTVMVASPALGQSVRAAVTNGAGQYRIVALPPGTYALTARLAGFITFERSDLEVVGTAVFTVNPELKLDGIMGTIITPVRDVQLITPERVMSAEVLDALPTGRTLNSQRPFAALYALDRIETIEGDLAQLLLRTPESFIHVMVKDENGVMRRWSVEWGGGLQINRQGVTRDMLKPRDHVVVTGHPGRNPEDHRLLLRTIWRLKDGWKYGRSIGEATGGPGILVPGVPSIR